MSVAAKILPLTFLGLLLVPLVCSFRGAEQIAERENRNAAPFPASPTQSWEAWQQFPDDFEAFYRDRFGLRHDAIRLSRWLSYYGHLSNPHTTHVLRGREGWLFFNVPSQENPIDIFTGRLDFSAAEIDLIVERLDAWHRWFKTQDITFLIVVPPNKITTYPQLAPRSLTPAPTSSRTEKLQAAMRARGLPVIDLAPGLQQRAVADPRPLFHRHDTHWNLLGAFTGYQQLGRVIENHFPSSPLLRADQIDFEPQETVGGDLSRMLGVDAWLRETTYQINSRNVAWAHAQDEVPFSVVEPTHFTKNDASLPRAIIYHDSFMIHLHGFLLTHFRESELHWRTQLDAAAIKAFEPDIVILEIVERSLHKLKQLAPPIDT